MSCCRLAEVLDERHVGSTDPKEFMKNHPLHQTGPGALREAATRFIGQPQVPTTGVPGFVNRIYEVSQWSLSMMDLLMKCQLIAHHFQLDLRSYLGCQAKTSQGEDLQWEIGFLTAVSCRRRGGPSRCTL